MSLAGRVCAAAAERWGAGRGERRREGTGSRLRKGPLWEFPLGASRIWIWPPVWAPALLISTCMLPARQLHPCSPTVGPLCPASSQLDLGCTCELEMPLALEASKAPPNLSPRFLPPPSLWDKPRLVSPEPQRGWGDAPNHLRVKLTPLIAGVPRSGGWEQRPDGFEAWDQPPPLCFGGPRWLSPEQVKTSWRGREQVTAGLVWEAWSGRHCCFFPGHALVYSLEE